MQDNQTRPYTNGTIIHNSGPVHIIASEYETKEKTPESKEPSPDYRSSLEDKNSPDSKSKFALDEIDEDLEEKQENNHVGVTETEKDFVGKNIEEKESTKEVKDTEQSDEIKDDIDFELQKDTDVAKYEETKESSPEERDTTPEEEVNNHVQITEPVDIKRNGHIRTEVEDFLKEEAKSIIEDEKTKELLKEAIEEDEDQEDDADDEDQEKSSVKVS